MSCSDKSSYFYRSRFCEAFRWFKETKKIWVFIYIIAFILFFIGLRQDRSFSSYIPTGTMYSVIDVVFPILIVIIIIVLQKKEFPEKNEYGETPWYNKLPLNTRKFLRLFTNTIFIVGFTIIVYYSIGSLASLLPQKYTYKTYTVKVTSLFGRGHGGCNRSIKTDFLNQINLENPSLYVTIVKNLDLHKLCMKYKTFSSMYKNKLITITTQESPISGIYIKSFDSDFINTENKNDQQLVVKPFHESRYNIQKTSMNLKKENNNTIPNTYPKEMVRLKQDQF